MKTNLSFILVTLFFLTRMQPLSAQNNALTFDGVDDHISFTTSPTRSYDITVHESLVSEADNTVTLTGVDAFGNRTLAEMVTQPTTNNALDFDGTNDYINCGFVLNPSSLSSLTLEAWVYILDAGYHRVFAQEYIDATNTGAGWFSINSNSHRPYTYLNNNQIESANTGVAENEWTHIAMVWDGSTITFYHNGIEDGTVTNVTGLLDSDNDLYLGWQGRYNNTQFYGQMDEVRIWDVARTGAQIRENMMRTLDGDESGLVAYYPLNESSGTIAYDATDSTHNGTLTNMDGETDWVDSEAFTTWLGGTSSDWSTESNWTDGVPTSSDNVGIYDWGDSSPVLITGQTVNNFLVAGGATVQLDAENTLNINGNILNEGTFLVKSTSAGTGSLIVNGASAGDIEIERYMTGNTWHLVSSPVPGEALSSFLGNNTGIPTKTVSEVDYRGMMEYLESSDSWSDFFLDTEQEGTLSSGKGFAARTTADGTITFAGSLSNGTQAVTLSKTESTGYGWNLIGNPFPSALNANATADATDNLLTVNSSVLDESYVALYIWGEQADYSGERNDYKIINHSGDNALGGESSVGQDYIQSGQGFIVKAAGDNVTFNFTEAMKTHQPTVAFKSAQTEWSTLVLEATMDEKITSAGIKFRDDMTAGLDVGYDAGILKTGFDIYTKLLEDNGVDFGLQCLPETGLEEYEIPVGIDAATSGKISFSLKSKNLREGITPILNDKKTGMSFPFNSEEDVYTATISESQGYGRFTLTFSSTTDVDDLLSGEPHFKAWYSNGSIYISGEIDGTGEATVYDINGRKVAIHQLSNSVRNQIDAPTGASSLYLVRISDSKRSEVLKVPVVGR